MKTTALIPALLLTAALPAAAESPSPQWELGKRQFVSCIACHSMDPEEENTLGPSLVGIVGSPVGSVEGFEYSDNMPEDFDVWSEENLHAWLQDPHHIAPNMCPAFFGIKSEKRRQALIEYLKNPLAP